MGNNFCNDLGPIISLLKTLVTLLQWLIPIGLIIYGMLDLGKAVIASKEDEVKKAWKAFGRRFLVAIGVFAVVWIVGLVFNMVADLGEGAIDYNEASWKACWNKIIK